MWLRKVEPVGFFEKIQTFSCNPNFPGYSGATTENHHPKMKTLEIKKTSSGQYTYRITDSFGERVPTQYGAYNEADTVAQARSRFSFDEIRDATECTVDVLNRDGKPATVTMTKDTYDRSSRAARNSADQFVGRITAMAGIPVMDNSGCPF